MTSYKKKDELYRSPIEGIVDFRFDESVAGVFPDMIQRSVPGYSTIISMIGMLAEEYARAGTNCYDLGCSVGAATLAICTRMTQRDCSIIAVDSSEAMLDQCRNNILLTKSKTPVDLVCADLRDVVLGNASVVVLNFTLQFISLEQRSDIIKDIYEAMVPGGVLILSEKICFDDLQTNHDMIEMHHAFKRVNGYSELEISQKRAALEKVLLPETIDAHCIRLAQAGFNHHRVWFQCFNFMSLYAIK